MNPFEINADSVLCVSPEMQSAFVGGLANPTFFPLDDGLVNSVVSEFNMIANSLSPPVIMPPSSSPMDEITTSGEVVDIGVPVVEVREDIFYFSLRCQLSDQGNPPFSDIIWTVADQEIPNNNVKYSITSDTLLIKNINEDDMGNYTCTVSNPVGSDEATTEVVVNPRPAPMRPDVTPPTPTPPPPDWVVGEFSDVSIIVCNFVPSQIIIIIKQ